MMSVSAIADTDAATAGAHRVGRKLIRLRRKLKIIVKTRVKFGSRTATERVATTLKAPKARRKH